MAPAPPIRQAMATEMATGTGTATRRISVCPSRTPTRGRGGCKGGGQSHTILVLEPGAVYEATWSGFGHARTEIPDECTPQVFPLTSCQLPSVVADGLYTFALTEPEDLGNEEFVCEPGPEGWCAFNTFASGRSASSGVELDYPAETLVDIDVGAD